MEYTNPKDEGDWVHIDKALIKALPKDRPYTLVEAVLSYTVDVTCGKEKSMRAYSRLWSWSPKKVTNFLTKMRVTVGKQKGNTKETATFRIFNPLQPTKKQMGNTLETEGKHYYKNKIKNKDIKGNSTAEITEIITHLNSRANTGYKPTTPKTQTLIRTRMKEGFTVEDFKHVINTKSKTWGDDEKMRKFLRPETLFGTKFESYLNEYPKEMPIIQYQTVAEHIKEKEKKEAEGRGN